MQNLGFLYIPDISGFTKFVTQTEIEHSNEIISDLIEVIIKSNDLGLNISEIEGDSVLFYLLGEPPALEAIVDQSKKIFMDFHAAIQTMTQEFDCNCKACTTISHLTLKFITHWGECKEVPIQKFTKLIGSDVILAHRLLKNSVPDKEYLLLSQKYLDNQESKSLIREEWINYKQDIEILEDFGEINIQYIPLSPLKSFVS